MTDIQLQQARNLIRKKPYLVWSTKDFENLSPQSILENILAYGNWQDFLDLTSIFGLNQTSKLFNEIVNKKRSNLKKQTINYFTKYFNYYAS